MSAAACSNERGSGGEDSFGTSLESGSDDSTSDESTGGEDDGPGVLFDVGFDGDLGAGGGPCGGSETEFSLIWIANSGEGTISKIDTVTLEELGRYRTGPTANGDPSRTSVSLSGAVAVANRSGGVTKVHARHDHCVESNGMPGIQTSTGKSDVLPWGTDECVAWHTPMPYFSQRPVAWAPGDLDIDTCTYQNEKLWTAGSTDPDFGGIDVVRVNGDDGMIEDTINIPITPEYYGAYGGAVDGQGNFWFSMLGYGKLVRVDHETLEYEIHPMPISGYGMTVDSKGRPWVCGDGVARFDTVSKTFDSALIGTVYAGGCMEDGEGRLWLAGESESVHAVDSESMQLLQTMSIQGQNEWTYIHGISIDFHGKVWGVSMEQSAYRFDPDTEQVDSYDGLDFPYTYSDMTGWALKNAGEAAG